MLMSLRGIILLPVVFASMLFLNRSAWASPIYSLTYIGQTDARAGISDTGIVAGNSGGQVYEWANGIIQDLGIGFAYGLNNFGAVVGNTGAGPSAQAVEWANGSIKTLGSGFAFGINDNGQVAGVHQNQATIWDAGIATSLLTPSGSTSVAFGINDLGQAVGYSSTNCCLPMASIWSNGQMQNLGTLPGSKWSIAYSSNLFGQIVGQDVGPTGLDRAFLFQNGSMSNLGVLPGYPNSVAISINNLGIAAGYSFVGGVDSTYRASLYENGTVLDLNSFLPSNSGWTLEVANGINDLGQIVGYGAYRGRSNVGFLLTPCTDNPCDIAQPDQIVPGSTPEPPGILLLGVAFVFMIFSRFKQTATSLS